MQTDPWIMVRLEPGGHLGDGIDDPCRVRRGGAHDQDRVLIHRGEQVRGRDPSGARVHLDPHEAQTEQVGCLAKRGVHGDRRDYRPPVSRGAAEHLARSQARQDAAFGPARGNAAVHPVPA